MSKTPDLVYRIPGEQPVIPATPETARETAQQTARQDLAQLFQNAAPAQTQRLDNVYVLDQARTDVQQVFDTKQGMTVAEAAAYAVQMGRGLQDKRLAVTR